jgi:drug/metabolite transporter (DMT)-like permease
MEKLEKYIKISYTLAFVLIMAGIVLVAIFEDYQQSGISLINIGAIILFVTFIRAKRYRNGPVKDERTIKIGAYGLSYSWLITFILIALLFWVEEFGISQMTVKQNWQSSCSQWSLPQRVFNGTFSGKGTLNHPENEGMIK